MNNNNIEQQNVELTDLVCKQLKLEGFDFAVAVATEPEIQAGAACGQLAIITDDSE